MLDGEFDYAVKVEKGDIVALDVRQPTKSGYAIIGASFDPEILNMVHFLEYDDDGRRRIEYMFLTLADGTTDVLIKMEPVAGGGAEIYKRVTVNVGKDDALF